MALQYDPRLYTGGNVVFDTSPTVEYAQRIQAKKQAKDEALNQYFNDLQTKINTAGVRQQDLSSPQGGINDEIEKWKQDWLLNKDAIKKGGSPQQEHLSKFQNILRKIDQSKNRAKTELEIGKAKFEGKYDPDDDDLNILGNIGKSIYDPTSYKQDGVSEYGWQDLSPAVPEFDVDRQNKFWIAATKGIQPGEYYNTDKQRTDKTTGKVFIPFEEKYSAEQIKRISDGAAELIKGDKSAKKYYNKIINNPESDQWEKLNKAYQSVYGSNSIVSTAEQAAQADAILRASVPTKQGEKPITDQDAAFQRQMTKMLYNSNLIAARSNNNSTSGTTKSWDLTEYPDTGDGGKNLTVPFQGYVVTAIGNNKLLAKNVIYYPQTKQFKVTEYTGRDAEGNPTGERTSMIKASTFRQNIKGNNPQADMKEFDALVGTEAKGQDTGGGTIKGSEVPKGAKVTQKDGAYYYNGKKII